MTGYRIGLGAQQELGLSSAHPPEVRRRTGHLNIRDGRGRVVAAISPGIEKGGWNWWTAEQQVLGMANGDYYVMGGKHQDQPRFAAPKLGKELLSDAPAAMDDGGGLYVYREDAWRPDGEGFYRKEIQRRLGEHWKSVHANETVQWIESGAPGLDPAPPLDRVRAANGIVRLGGARPKLEDHSVSPYTPIHLPVRFDPDARCPTFSKFMEEALEPRVRKIAQEIMGYLIVPDNSMQKAFLAVGEGGNGKTTWVNVCTALLGEDNSAAHELHALSDSRFAAADLYGKLANVCADISSNELSSSALFRAITGGDAIMGEHKYKSPFKFTPYARLVFSANRYPPIANPTNALFDRWVVLPFDQRFRGTDAEDPQLIKKLTEQDELSGILNYALGGLRRLRKQGHFTTSKRSDAALRKFRLAADTVASFLAEEARKPGFYITSHLWEQYRAWCQETGHQPLTRNQFYERVEARLGQRSKVKGREGWRVRGKT